MVKRSPHEILGVEPTSTKQEVKEQYKRLILRVHPDVQRVHVSDASREASEIIGSYTAIMKSPPQTELYTEELLRTNLRKYADDFFERISEYCGMDAPRFSEPDFERFYHIFTNFKTQRDFESREARERFCLGVRTVARAVRSLDRRMHVVSASVERAPAPSSSRERKIREYPFGCEHCGKGFNSPNQTINHLRSRKHFDRISMAVENPREYIDAQISEIAQDDERESSVEEESVEEEPVPVEICERPRKELRLEPLAFRTCATCRAVFTTRTELFAHLKAAHKT